MTTQRRSFLTLSAAAGVGISLLGTGQAVATARAGAPSRRFAVGVRQYVWSRGSRRWTTYVHYPATGAPGGSPVTNAPAAQGVFPVCEFMHGFNSSPQKSLTVIRPLAEAGFHRPRPPLRLTARPDARITAAIPMSCVDMGNPSPPPPAPPPGESALS
ncbi:MULTISPECIES: hypothetical protein [Streptomyces]|uniref:hypothetical protein n=1 Tax=Streptomyces TaxID=1883 RepID=UPI000AFD08A5|nr:MULTISPECIES: hypothetical protein [Streptomyces]